MTYTPFHSPFASFAQSHKGNISLALSTFLDEKKAEAGALSSYLERTVIELDRFVMHGGKRVRSLLVLLGYLSAGGKIVEGAQSAPIYQVAAAIEMVHKYLLVLDDIADKDEMRNSQPTVWKHYQELFREKGWQNPEHHGRTLAEIDSALLASLATQQIASLPVGAFPPEKLLTVLGLINKFMYFDTVAGWLIHYQLNHVALREATEEEFMRGLTLVSAQYTFVGPLLIGATLANNSDEVKEALKTYGFQVGTAFQIQDDILGLFGDPQDTGKPVGNDVREGKKTLLLQRAYQLASQADKSFLEDVCGKNVSDAELKRVQSIVQETGSLAYSQELAKKYVAEGVAALKTLNDVNPEVAVLVDLANFVIQRNV